MAQEALEGEFALAEKKEAHTRLMTLLGLDPKPGSGDTVVPDIAARVRETRIPPRAGRRRGRIGDRSPVRDEIGIAFQNVG